MKERMEENKRKIVKKIHMGSTMKRKEE